MDVSPEDSSAPISVGKDQKTSSPLALKWIPHNDGIYGRKDIWAGLSSTAERRKAQNRLHQRTWRRRKAASRAQLTCNYAAETKDVDSDSSCLKSDTSQMHDIDLWNVLNSVVGFPKIERPKRAHAVAVCRLNDPEFSTVAHFRKWAHSNCVLTSPDMDRLIVLVKYNVFRALVSNCIALGFIPEDSMDDDAISPFCMPSNHSRSHIQAMPAALQPTDLQCKVVHHPWIDLLPVPRMRQNLISAGNTFDDMELCGDLIGLFSAGTGRTGIIVWGEPWDIAGWEVTESFLEYWGWTIAGCWEIFESTNQWRRMRGEKRLCFDAL